MWTSRSGRVWELRTAEPRVVQALAAGLGLREGAARVLAARGLDLGAAREFLSPGAGAFHDPGLLLGLDRAVARIEDALRRGEHVRLVTDYDVDGTTSCLVLHAALDRRIAASGSAARVTYHLPDRFTEGYGLSLRAVETAAAEGVGLLVTADIGVRDHASVRRARELGLDVVVVDHHLPAGEEVPDAAYAVVCPPQRGCGYPNKSLAACGVSLKLATALLDGDPRRDVVLASMLKLAAIGTVADVVDLATMENRAIVALGLEALNGGRHGAGLQALLDVAGVRVGSVDATALGFRIGPRINAAGRLQDATAVVRLLRERDAVRAARMAHELDALNRERQGIQERLVEMALARVPDPLPPFVVVWGPEDEGWHRGVVGIVASKLREKLHRPVAVVATLPGGLATGSVRSVPTVHAVRALDAAAPLFVRYGGHAAAAGFTLPSERLPALADRLGAFVAEHAGTDALVAREEVDVALPVGALDVGLVEELGRLEPCGRGNPTPKLAVEGRAEAVRVVKDRHLFFRVGALEGVWWGGAEHRELLAAGRVLFGTAAMDAWNGRVTPRVTVEDVA